MTATNYTDQRDYIKFLTNKAKEAHSGCGDGCKDCTGGCDEDDCSCCPKGLVAIYNDAGRHLGCLTPNDAELFNKNTYVCEDGYVKLYINATGEFLGCVSEETFQDLYNTVNGNNS